ncbi:GGDEF domain-containing protein [Methylobacterium sp. E-041]|uniref:GGDEF domain-containing protein n=1 Tax=Methylobacterium sp. E-041 TaxID=2836573 RepID=UPI001FBA6B59|nr:GGDEF domain-containing protein [Methylobacterium sp. E-041]MCJ2109192.1 GGDEF domain-containing protein [Methylobacterium sp. E-041]
MIPSIHPRDLIDRLDAVSCRATWTILAASCFAFVVFDWLVPEVGTGPLYIPLIALAGWRLGARAACAVAFVAAFLNILPLHGVDAGMSAIGAVARGMVRLGAYAFVTATVCGLRRVHDRERYAARHDALTGALNRLSFEEHARHVLERCAADGTVTVLALADIDGFKSVNDTFGHAEGDAVLRRFAEAGMAAIGERDRFGRLGGDEFVLLLQARTVAAAESRIATVHRRLCDGLKGSPHTIGVSLGALVVRLGANLEWPEAVREADRLMYVAKRAGTGGFQIGTFAETTVSAMPSSRASSTSTEGTSEDRSAIDPIRAWIPGLASETAA